MDLGPNCDYGMAYQISGKPQKKPGVFQCNIGSDFSSSPTYSYSYSLCLFLSSCRSYIAGPSSTDFYATAGSTLKMMKSLVDDPEAGDKGFVSDIVAQFNLEESR